MIQRIQTVFLLLALIAMALFIWAPVVNFEPKMFNHLNGLRGWETGYRGFGYFWFLNAILSGTAIGLTLINIFLFKMRDLQMLLCIFAVVFIAVAQAFVYYIYQTYPWPSGYVILTWWNILAPIAIVLQLLAWFYIRKDEHLIKSLDRLR